MDSKTSLKNIIPTTVSGVNNFFHQKIPTYNIFKGLDYVRVQVRDYVMINNKSGLWGLVMVLVRVQCQVQGEHQIRVQVTDQVRVGIRLGFRFRPGQDQVWLLLTELKTQMSNVAFHRFLNFNYFQSLIGYHCPVDVKFNIISLKVIILLCL